MTLHAQLTGSVLHGTYSVVRLIGEGGMGTVYEAIHQRLNRRFAVKVLHRKAASDSVAVARFQREAQITSNLGSKHIVDVVDFNITQDGVRYLVMELLEGEDLEARIGRLGRLQLSQAAPITEQVVAALYSAHRGGIVHRDLKPSNIFLCRQEEGEVVKVLDFGISKILGDQGGSITTEDALIGTPHYMAPEQITDSDVDYRADVWATGAIVYEMLCGVSPFHSPRLPTVFHKIINEDPLPLNFYVKDLPEGFEQVVMRALSKHPDDRPPSIRAFWRELSEVAGLPYKDLSSSWPGSGEQADEAPASRLDVTMPQGLSLGGATLPADGNQTRPRTNRTTARSAASPLPRVVLAGGLLVLVASALMLFSSKGNNPQPAAPPEKILATASSRVDLSASKGRPTGDTGPAPESAVDAATKQRTQRALWVRTKPVRAKVRIRGGRSLGTTPLRGVPVGPEAAVLLFAAPGYRSRRVQVPEGHEPVRFETLILEPLAAATLQIAVRKGTIAVPARVFLDGESVGQAPLVLNDLRPGRHVVEARFEAAGSGKKRVTLRPGQTLRLSLKLQQTPSSAGDVGPAGPKR